jgi:hypothetical protein
MVKSSSRLNILSILLFVGSILVSQQTLASPISVPLDHWSYHFVERFQAKGVLKDYLSNTKPYTRDEMAKMLLQIIKQVENGKLSLSKTEKAQLDDLKSEFARELGDLGVTGITARKYLLDWSGDGKTLIAQAGYTQDVSVKRGTEDHRIYKGTLQVLLQGDLKENLFFYSNNRASYEDSTEPLPLWTPYLDRSRYPWEAISDSYLVLRLPWADIQMGKDAILWGPGYHGVVGLAGVDPTFDTIKLPVEVWKIKFTSILGFLRDDLGKQYRSDIVRKYISAHRIEVKPFSGFCIAWQEAYVYAENLHIELLNPIMPYQMAEDYLGDIGNNTMEGDVDICLIPKTRLYASLFLDDLHSDKNPFTYGGFRWAALCGFLIADPFGIDDTDFRAEYARVEPWTYPHKGIIQNPPIPTSYKHFNTPLGHWIGPNADDLFFEINHFFSKDMQAKLSYSRIRKGEIGGSLYDYSNEAMTSEKHFLGGIVEKTQTLMLEMIYRIAWDSELNVNYSLIKIDNKQNEEAKLPSSFSTKQPWKSGQKWHQNALKATLALKY